MCRHQIHSAFWDIPKINNFYLSEGGKGIPHMYRKINTGYFICCETLSQGMWNEVSFFSVFQNWAVPQSSSCFHNIRSRSGLSFFRSILSVLSAPHANITVHAMGNMKSRLSSAAWRTAADPVSVLSLKKPDPHVLQSDNLWETHYFDWDKHPICTNVSRRVMCRTQTVR